MQFCSVKHILLVRKAIFVCSPNLEALGCDGWTGLIQRFDRWVLCFGKVSVYSGITFGRQAAFVALHQRHLKSSGLPKNLLHAAHGVTVFLPVSPPQGRAVKLLMLAYYLFTTSEKYKLIVPI